MLWTKVLLQKAAKTRAINNAIKGLVERADFSALTSLIADAQQLAEETDVDDDVTPPLGQFNSSYGSFRSCYRLLKV